MLRVWGGRNDSEGIYRPIYARYEFLKKYSLRELHIILTSVIYSIRNVQDTGTSSQNTDVGNQQINVICSLKGNPLAYVLIQIQLGRAAGNIQSVEGERILPFYIASKILPLRGSLETE